jgi:hypothetical protein
MWTEEKPTETGYYWFYGDELAIMKITKDQVSEEDIIALDELGFFWSEEGCFMSYRFGSA